MAANSSYPASDALAPIWRYYCPDLRVLESQIEIGNASRNQVQASLKGCINAKVTEIYKLYDQFDTYQSLFFGILGLIGSSFTLITLIRTRSVYFKASTYRYFRVLAVIQALVMLSLIHSAIRRLLSNRDTQWYGWYVVTVYVEPVLGVAFANWADLIICFLSFERAVACLAPSYFRSVQRRPVFTAVIVITFLAASVSDLPQAIVNTIVPRAQTRSYTTHRATGSVVSFFDRYRVIFSAVKSSLLILCTTAAVVGFARAHLVKRRLHHASIGSSRAQRQNGQLEWKVTAQLCVLQIAQAVPTIANALTLTIGGFTLANSAPTLDGNNLASASNAQVSAYIGLVRSYYLVFGFFNATKSFGHSVHAYLYLMFSQPFRRAARESTIGAILLCQSQSSPSGTQAQPPVTGVGRGTLHLVSTVNPTYLNPKAAWRGASSIENSAVMKGPVKEA